VCFSGFAIANPCRLGRRRRSTLRQIRTDLELKIQACTRFVEKGGEPDKLSLAFTYRGQSQFQKGFIDAAVSDYNMAIALNPESAQANLGRGWSTWPRRLRRGHRRLQQGDLHRT